MNQILDKIPYDQLNSLPKWQRWAAVGGALALIFGVYFYFFYMEGVNKISGLDAELKTVETNLETTRQQAKKLPDLKEKIEILGKNLLQARKELPSEKEIPSFLKTISDEGKMAGLDFLLFQPEQETVLDFYARVPVRIEVQGQFHEVMTFFDRVRRLPRIVDVENISIQIQKDGKSSFFLKTACVATTYKFIEGAEKQTAPAAAAPPK
jgi:type IV pilus assembly protein PilO